MEIPKDEVCEESSTKNNLYRLFILETLIKFDFRNKTVENKDDKG